MRLYFKNNPIKFHPGPISSDGALGFLERGRPKKKKKKMKNKMKKKDNDDDE